VFRSPPPPRSRRFVSVAAALVAVALIGTHHVTSAAEAASLLTVPPIPSATAAFSLSVNASCEEAAQWAESVESSSFASLSAISAVPLVYRRAIYSRLTEQEQIGLWRAHLTRESERTPMSAAQRAFLSVASDSLEIWFSADSAARVTLSDRMRPRAKDLFGDQLATALFAKLGPDDPVSPSAPASNALAPNCSCATADDWCGGSNHCTSGGCTTGGSCGWFWQKPCNGLCYQNES
jgi:hypothetical protein